MKSRILIIVCLVCILAPALRWFPSLVFAQQSSETSAPRDEVPPAALLTERGTELAKLLFLLRRSESTIGRKHPALPQLRQQIADVEEELKAWQPGPNPFRRAETPATGGGGDGSIPAINVTDLRQIVLTLAQDVEDLKQQLSDANLRLKKLERRESPSDR